jgi:hypothetical protein
MFLRAQARCCSMPYCVEEYTMYLNEFHLFWLLLSMALASLLYLSLQISRSEGYLLLSEIICIPEFPRPLRIVPAPGERKRRPIEWISFEEFKLLLAQKPRDFIVIDLRPDALWSRFPVADVFVLDVTPNELMEILEWFPSDRSAVFYGASDLGIARIQTSPSMHGSAPFYFLDDLSSQLGAA